MHPREHSHNNILLFRLEVTFFSIYAPFVYCYLLYLTVGLPNLLIPPFQKVPNSSPGRYLKARLVKAFSLTSTPSPGFVGSSI